ncbi:MAG: HIT family protein [Burkholderiaceae bacterium]
MKLAGCALCESAGGATVFQGAKFRVIRADEAGFPAFYRLVWSEHVAEFSDLPSHDRLLCMEAVALIEQALREQLQPTKVNLATLGNVVPHLHWHVIARFDWDSHFPAPVWAQAVRQSPPERLTALRARLAALDQDIERRLGGLAAAEPL